MTILSKWKTSYLEIPSTQIARFAGQHGAHLGPIGPRWAPCWLHEPCYEGIYCTRAYLMTSFWHTLHPVKYSQGFIVVIVSVPKGFKWPFSHIDGLVQERRNSSALAVELRLFCNNPSICSPCLLHSKHNCQSYCKNKICHAFLALP